MERQFQLTQNGQEVQQGDFNLLGEVSALADDRVLAELFRLKYGSATPQKSILPFGVAGNFDDLSTDSTALVHGSNAADAKIRVMPFRAIIGSTTLVGTSPLENVRGIRSGIFSGNGAGTVYQSITLGANASGNPRWDLVYAAVTPNVDEAAVNRYVKDPSTEVIGVQSLVVTKKTSVTVAVSQGTPAASPTRPALPADAAGTYYIALAYIYVANGFTSGTQVARGLIHEVAPCITLNSAVGGGGIVPANQQHSVTPVAALASGTVDTRQSGALAPTIRTGAYLPPTMVGGERRFILFQNGLAPISHADGDVVDNSIDWRFRYFKSFIQVLAGSGTTEAFASDRAATGTIRAGSTINRVPGTHTITVPGQSFYSEGASLPINPADSNGAALLVTDTNLSQMASGGSGVLMLYVRNTDGALILKKTSAAVYQMIIWLEATGQYSNFGTV